MRFRSRNQSLGEIPEIDITPMLNVIMVVLAFFVVVSTTLTAPPGDLSITLPASGEDDGAIAANNPPLTLRITLEADGALTIDGRTTNRAALMTKLPAFLQNNPKSSVSLVPGPEVTYQTVLQLLVEMQAVGGDRVSLAVGTTQGRSPTDP